MLGTLAAIGLGYLAAQPQLWKLQSNVEVLQIEAGLQKERIRGLNESHGALEIELQAERQAQHETIEAMTALRKEAATLKTELSFYQNVMAPERSVDGVLIEKVALESSAAPGHYRFQVLLTQQKKRKTFAKGSVSIRIIGSLKGKTKTLKFEDYGVDASKLAFAFRYFQELDGSVTLPEGFTPEKLEVSVKVRGKGKSKSTQSSFDVATLLGS